MAGIHSQQTVADGIHIIQAFEYANAAARTGAAGLTAADVGKVARQLDNDTFWVLQNNAPVTWAEITPGGSVPVFGTELVTSQNLSDVVTTSTTFSSYLTLATGSIPAGGYIININYVWSHDSTTNDFEAQLLEGASQIYFHKQEPQDAGGGGTGGTDQRFPCSYSITRTLAAGSYTYDLQFRTDSAGDESTMYEAYMTFWRIS